MSLDLFSPTTPARIRTLVLPIGKVKRSRFYSFLKLLNSTCEIRLGDVSPDPRPNRNMFNPLAFPDGVVLYDFSTSVPPSSHLALSPFEMFREPQVILGISDCEDEDLGSVESLETKNSDSLQAELLAAALFLKEEYPRALVSKILLFNTLTLKLSPDLLDDVICVPPAQELKTTTMRTIFCDITALLLAEMTTIAISIKALPSIVSPTIPQSASNGVASAQWYHDDSPSMNLTESHNAEIGRSSSPAAHNVHRHSMPAISSASVVGLGNPTIGSSSVSTNSSRQTHPAKTFDEIVPQEPGITSISGSRRGSSTVSREQSRDRVSVHGFGPGSLNERNRNKGKCRIGLVVGSLYLQAGRWHDALRELSDGATLARSFSDHLWHAKALENLIICMILLVWSGSDFKIPQVCYQGPEKSNSKSQAPTVNGNKRGENAKDSASSAILRQEMATLLPDMINEILSMYSRGASQFNEAIPQLAYSECVIRFAKVLTGINLAGGVLDDLALHFIVRGTQPDFRLPSAMGTRVTILPSRESIADVLLRALPGSNELSGLSPVDQLLILAGIASVFSSLGLQRKKAIILKEYLGALIQALTQAKKAGAAEAGFHPATKLVNLTSNYILGLDESPERLEDFLNLLCQVYGIPETNWSHSIGSETLQIQQTTATMDASIETLPAQLPSQLVGNFVLRFFGSVNVKSDVLRTCIYLCEALSDFHGVLHYTSALLRTAGPGIAPSADTSDVLVTLAREEQLLLVSNVSRTVANAKSLGIHGIEAEFWDEFIVRGVYLVAPSTSFVLHNHRRADLGVVKSVQNNGKQGPFLHNPFLDKRESKAVENLLVAGDQREFVVALQNPYDFEVIIESLRLMSGAHELASAHDLILRPYRTQSFSVMGSVREVGRLSLHGCIIKIFGCRERVFPIFKEAWTPEQDVKVKNIGLIKTHQSRLRVTSDDSTSSLDRQNLAQSFPKPASIVLTVIPEQPNLVVRDILLPQSALMLLEGEIGTFRVSIKNTSSTVAADFVHLSFRDSTTMAIEEALGNKKLAPAELYELEYQLTRNPAIKACGIVSSRMEPAAIKTFEFEVVGKPGLTSAVIQLDYANISMPHLQTGDNFFTRQITIPISVTVNASIQLQRLDIMPVSTSARDLAYFGAIAHDPDLAVKECCLMLLDLRNAWPTPLEISLQVLSRGSDKSLGHTSKDLVQPGHVCRMALLIPKMYIRHAHARILSANERQYVVSTTGLSPEAERRTREIFWSREELLKALRGSWRQEDDARSGTIDLRSMIRLNSRMMKVLRLDDVLIEMDVHDVSSSTSTDKLTRRKNKSKRQGLDDSTFEIRVDDYLNLRTKITNRSNATIYPILRLQPLLSHHPSHAAFELGRRFVWSGLLQQVLAPLEPGGTVEANLAICALCSGEYEICASVEEIKACERSDDHDDIDDVGEERGREDDGAGIPDLVASFVGRRTWTASEPCRIRAVEREERE